MGSSNAWRQGNEDQTDAIAARHSGYRWVRHKSVRVAFGAGQDVKKAPVSGGPAVLVGRIPSALVLSGTWSPDGESIVFGAWSGAPGRLYEVPVQCGWLESPLKETELNPIGMFI